MSWSDAGGLRPAFLQALDRATMNVVQTLDTEKEAVEELAALSEVIDSSPLPGPARSVENGGGRERGMCLSGPELIEHARRPAPPASPA